MTDDNVLKSAENLINIIQFWKEPEIIGKRKIRLKIRNNYKTVRSLFNGFFDKIRESTVTDYIDNDTMLISKIIHDPDKAVLSNAVRSIGHYGFTLSIHPIDSTKCKVVMCPSAVISSYITELYLTPEKVEHSLTLSKMNLLFH